MSSPIKVCTATERVLTTVELLTHILEHSYYHNYNSGQTYRNALVSKTWSNEALDILWSGIGSFLYLLKLLGPMSAVEEVEGVNFKYDRHIRPSDWDVFQRYSSRVRQISHLEDYSDVDNSVIYDLVGSAPLPISLLVPNLRGISYEGRGPLLRLIPLFTNESLESLCLDYPNPEIETMLMRTLSYIPHRAPNLRCLRLSAWAPFSPHGFDMILLALPQLREISVPSTLFVAQTLKVLAHLSHLEVLHVTSPHVPNRLDATAKSLADTFPALTTFVTDTLSFDDIASLIQTSKPRNLRRLDVSARRMEYRQTWLHLIVTVTSACPAVQEIEIEASQNGSESDLDQLTLSFPSWTRRSLSLTSLVLNQAPRLCLDVEIMKTLLCNFPSLETLELNELVGPTTLPLSALSELAPLCPCMKFLTLCMDTEQSSTSTPTNTRFSCLSMLSVGISPLKSSAFNVATFLATVLPDPCVLRVGRGNIESANWKPVIEFLPMMLELRTARERN